MQKSSAVLKVVAGSDVSVNRAELARKFRASMADHLRAHTEGTNVNPRTLLATDYLNHFNEMIMLLDMLPSSPKELACDLGNWRHKSYEQHFHETGFRDKSLAIAGYRNAPEEVRDAFDAAISKLEYDMVSVLDQIAALMASGQTDGLPTLCVEASARLRGLADKAAAIINGETPDVPVDGHHTQEAVDALFN
ncbi:MAG: hypothetical protein VX871_10570 [Pseudomonadota bacterium]|nr:hypothetical protein [Pseudomonadota bacterium]